MSLLTLRLLQRRAADQVETAKVSVEPVQPPDHQDCQNGTQLVVGLTALGSGAVTAFGAWLKMKLRPPHDPRLGEMAKKIAELEKERDHVHTLRMFKNWFRSEGVKELAAEMRRRS